MASESSSPLTRRRIAVAASMLPWRDSRCSWSALSRCPGGTAPSAGVHLVVVQRLGLDIGFHERHGRQQVEVDGEPRRQHPRHHGRAADPTPCLRRRCRDLEHDDRLSAQGAADERGPLRSRRRLGRREEPRRAGQVHRGLQPADAIGPVHERKSGSGPGRVAGELHRVEGQVGVERRVAREVPLHGRGNAHERRADLRLVADAHQARPSQRRLRGQGLDRLRPATEQAG